MRSPRREKYRSSKTARAADGEDDDGRSSRHRKRSRGRHKRSDKGEGDRARGDEDGVRGDEAESSRHRGASSSSRHRARGDDSRAGGDERSSSRRRDKTRDRHKRHGEGGRRARGDVDSHGGQRREGSQRKAEGGRDEGGSSGRHRSGSHEKSRGGDAHRGRDRSRRDQPQGEGDKPSTKASTDDSEAGIEGWVPVSPGRRVSSSSNGLEVRGAHDKPKEKGERDDHEIDARQETAGKVDGFEEEDEAGSQRRRVSSSGKPPSQLQDETRRGSAEDAAASEELASPKSYSRKKRASRADSQRPQVSSTTLEANETISGENENGTGWEDATDGQTGRASDDDEDPEGETRTARTAVEPARGVVKLSRSRGGRNISVPSRDSDARAAQARGTSSSKKYGLSGAVRGSGGDRNGEDVQVMQLREIPRIEITFRRRLHNTMTLKFQAISFPR